MAFANGVGLWALLALVPFIILYLIRPKPKDQVIPSLMFLIKETRAFQQKSFLRRLLHNLLFFIQLLALSGLAFSIAEPYIVIPHEVISDNTVIVIDASASMQTLDGLNTRFEKAVDEAKKYVSGTTSIILAESIPVIVLQDGSESEALGMLEKLKPRATSTNLGDALLLADDVLKNRLGKIIVISDFIPTEGSDLLVAKRAITAKGIDVKFADVWNKARNIGIVDMKADKQKTKVYIKNYNDKEETVTLKVVHEGKKLDEKSIKILPLSMESVVFETPTGISKVEIAAKDDLSVDNAAYISAPQRKKFNVLLITNKAKNNYLKAALQASPEVALTIAEPPVIPSLNFDAVIMYQVDKNNLLPGTFQDVSNYLKKGGSFVISAQDDLDKLDAKNVLPVTLESLGGKTPVDIILKNQITKDTEIGSADKHWKSKAKENTIVMAQAENASPLLAYNGKTVYYGIFDDFSDFKASTSYPIFWDSLLKFLVKSEDINEYNFPSGKVLAIPEQNVKTPSGSVKTSKLVLDEMGIYELKDRKVASNLINDKESEISKETSIVKDDKLQFEVKKEKKGKNLNLDTGILLLAFLLVCAEIVYLKVRGDV